MKKELKITAIIIGFIGITLSSCKKDECHECHFDGPNGEVELGEKCGDDLEEIEANGHEENGVIYEVHCHEH